MRINEQIRTPKVRLIGPKGEQIGIVDIKEALRRSQEEGQDLLEIVPTADPPVCKILDFGKYRYEIQKREKEARKKQTHTGEVKELRFRPVTDDHDYQFKVKHAVNFLKEGYKVKMVVVYKGREIANKEAGIQLAERMVTDLESVGKLDGEMKFEGRNMVMIFIKNR
ncbi:MAG TPA: translation initiation factor IF-3 [bacterium]|nr:translation initiation factor IF-3 [bacterium]HMW35834.1 translation initiation factor IF-3 [bacterium]HMY34703.1 translation initiation factor IF-3 [bacterium]HNB56036.1 translation initiation factor IF-3 [bacterium]HNC49904.1 translation initiation factor IF-3 [bacterium]